MKHGTMQKGVVNKTENQIKKHQTSLSLEEKQEIVSIVHSNLAKGRLTYTKHAHTKKDVTFREKDILQLLHNLQLSSMIIEVNANFREGYCHDVRILVRSPKQNAVMMHEKGGSTRIVKANMCFVYSLTYHRIVTVYWNEASDNHETLNPHRYVTESFLPYIREVRTQQIYNRKRNSSYASATVQA